MTLSEAVETLKRYCDERYDIGRNCDNCQVQVIRETSEIQYEWCALSQSPTYWNPPMETNIYDQKEIKEERVPFSPDNQEEGERMSIIIKGITKEQFYKDTQKVAYMDVGWEIDELPPHGRLIDADAFKYEECGSCDGFCERCDGYECSMCRKECRCDFMKALDEATTIIEAEEGEKE